MKKNYAEPIFSNCETIIDSIVHRVDQLLDAFSYVYLIPLKIFNEIVKSIIEIIYDLFNKDTRLARLLRIVSLPWSIAIPKTYKYFFSNRNRKPHIFRPGIHMVRAVVGGGKSLTSFILAEIFLEETGLSSYFTSPVEKPQVTDDGEFLYVNHRHINLNDYYDKNGRKIKKFNTEKHKMIHKDERHLEFNPRLNNSKEYKNKFIPQQQDEILMRHQGITHIYKYSQYSKLDSQDMQALTYMHDVETVKDIPIKRWIDRGRFDYIPVVLKFTTYIIDVDFSGDMKRKKIGSCKIRVSPEVLDRFDTHAESYRDAGLPVDYK